MRLAAVLKKLEEAPDGPLARLVQGDPAEALMAPLAGETPDSLFGTGGDPAARQAVLAGARVAADYFEEAHDIAQALPDAWGAWWHAILHRREPDPSNALYWYRRTRVPDAVSTALAARAMAILAASPAGELDGFSTALKKSGRWEPVPFVRACEQGQMGNLGPASVSTLVAVQRAEWRAWLDHCLAAARTG